MTIVHNVTFNRVRNRFSEQKNSSVEPKTLLKRGHVKENSGYFAFLRKKGHNLLFNFGTKIIKAKKEGSTAFAPLSVY